MELIDAALTVSSIVVTVLVPFFLPLKKSALQAIFYSSAGGQELVLRNVSQNVVFIDRIDLHKCPVYDGFCIRNITRMFSQECNVLKLNPGEQISAYFSIEHLKEIVLKNYELCYGKEYSGKGKCRISYKLVVQSSEGTICTGWVTIQNPPPIHLFT